jgi:outer membrane protein assembly factor BamB
MTLAQTDESMVRRPIRLWPGVVAAVLLALLWFVIPVVLPAADSFAAIGALAAAVAVVLWWLFFSRVPWSERVGAILLAIVGLVAIRRAVHESIAGGMMGMMLFIYAVPVLCLALVAGAVVGRGLSTGLRRAAMAAFILLACGVFALVRTGGMMGFHSEFHWRWTLTPEERLLAQTAGEKDPVPPPAPAAAPAVAPSLDLTPGAPADSAPARPADPSTGSGSSRAQPNDDPARVTAPTATAVAPKDPETKAEWPGFRGPERDNIIRGVRIATDWSKSPPVELWRRPIGPGWSSFAVHGNRVYTQEQRGDDEIVSCYDLKTGAPVWRHRDPARFWESNAGAGPRGTPTLGNGRVYALGATGIVNALDAVTGTVVWSRNAASDTGAKLPGWGFSGSPLVVDQSVIVAASGRLAAYEVTTGTLRWSAQTGGGGYSSPQLATIDGVAQILLLNSSGAASVAPADGKLLWKHEWNSDGIVQPAVIGGRDVLIGSGSGGAEVGVRRLAVARGSDGWRVEERWTSNGLKPYFNDFVVHNGHAFGFDGAILSCIDLTDGKRKWKGGRYGQGQMILLPDQDVLLVLSEEGELALVQANANHFTELARFPAIEGKTWNHPVLVGNVLLARNSEEMVALRLSTAGS